MKLTARTRRLIASGAAVALAVGMSGCGGTPTLVGNWQADDGSGAKVVTSNGACQGMFYSQGKPLDIGGGMTCSLSTKALNGGKYSLVVSQPPNQASYLVDFSGNDSATVYDTGGGRLYSMKRE